MKKSSHPILNHFKKYILQGIFWVLPIVAIIAILFWLYDKMYDLSEWLFGLVGFTPKNHEGLWIILVLVVFLFVVYVIGYLVQTRLAQLFESLFHKIPGYTTLRDVIQIFNSSKEGENKVLVVAIKGFAYDGYNIGLMYSQKESIIKDHYTVTLSMTPIPNGGYMFEVHKDRIYIFEEATFDDNLQYLLSMGVKSMTEVLKEDPKAIDEMMPLGQWLESKKKSN